ncbi:hypothetical protein WICMUC_003607 [Wickerhamomyces mucosus]|uniref:tRNA:m(4)X modification enzyme TRM13 n=1 Tax=Wickerhamomyces mucosus TaxID=1378264 RepID=A0A9P8TBY2_9ASCO|nr:hypothetical protein WICMUC_003607 [Wickerhamomyces mucosus]
MNNDDDIKISAKRRRLVKQGKQFKERLQCEFIIPKKNRRCPLTRKETSQYCAQHIQIQTLENKRIPCPIDSRHSIWEKDLQNHTKKCEIKNDKDKQVSWFKLDYNCDSTTVGNSNNINNNDDDDDDENFTIDYSKWIPIVNEIYESNYKPLPLIQLDHKGTQSRMSQVTNQKHILQQSSLISHLNTRDLLSSDLNYVEFGCGRAELSRYLLQCIIFQNKENPLNLHSDSFSNFLLIDRSPTRLKLDSKMIKDLQDFNLKPNKIHRIKIDIKDLFIDDIISKEFDTNDNDHKKFVAISKHLCGAATDLTIQCILNSKNFKSRFKGMIVAMCCRHCCDYNKLNQFSKNYLSNLNIDRIGFKHLMKFASWAVNGRRPNMKDNDGKDHSSGLNIKEREDLGLKARRIIDESRKFALEQNDGFKVELCKYVKSDISLENTSLIVTNRIE